MFGCLVQCSSVWNENIGIDIKYISSLRAEKCPIFAQYVYWNGAASERNEEPT